MSSSAKEMAFDLLTRLLAGERGGVPARLGLLLEKSARLDRADNINEIEEDYSRLVPPEFSGLWVSPQTRNEVIAALCTEVSRNPDPYLIATCASTGSELAVKTLAKVLTNPARALTLNEYAIALSWMVKSLPRYLSENSEPLPKSDVERLAQLCKDLQNVKGGVNNEDKSSIDTINYFAPLLLITLAKTGAATE